MESIKVTNQTARGSPNTTPKSFKSKPDNSISPSYMLWVPGQNNLHVGIYQVTPSTTYYLHQALELKFCAIGYYSDLHNLRYPDLAGTF